MDTPQSRYDALSDRVFALYEEKRFAEALEVLSEPRTGVEPWFAELAHTEACVRALQGDPAGAFRVLQAASDAGGWWDAGILTEDDDLAGLQSLPGFQGLVALSASRQKSDPRPAIVKLPPSGKPGGVVVALHGAAQNAARAAADWAGVLDLGYALVCVDSSQHMSPMYQTWPHRDRAIEDIARALAELPDELKGLPLIAAGFSAGGRAALDWALTAQPERAVGVVVLAPALRALPAQAQGPLSPATILIGTEDDLLEVVDGAAAQLATFGLTIDKLPGLGHESPVDLTDHLREVLPGINV